MNNSKLLVISEDKTFDEDLKNNFQFQTISYDFTLVSSLTEAKDELDKGSIDIVMLDISACHDLNLIKAIIDFNIPIIVSSDFNNQEQIAQILDYGADNYLIRDDNKNYLKLLKRTLDTISINRNIEHILNKIETQYKAIYENNIAMYFTLDMDNRILSANSFASENLGYSKQDLEGNLFSDLAHDDDRKEVIEQLELCKLNPGQIFHWEFRLRRQDGSYIWVRDNAFTIEDKQPKTLFISCEDITVRKQAEEEIIKSQKLESLETLAGGIANDFNNLLTGIIGNISLIKAYLKKDDKTLEKLLEIENASMRAKDLTQKLFIFSSGGSPEKILLNPGDLVKQSADFMLKDSRLDSEIREDENLHQIFADKDQMLQVINNIIVNADQAMQGGGKLGLFISNIIINGEESTTPLSRGKYVKISVIDEGAGISDENLPKIFDPYFTTKKTASGLGLSTAHSIISKHNGYIDVSSESGAGTRVDVYLPAHTGQPESQIQKDQNLYDKNLLKGKKVLVMDDEDLIRKVAGNILEHLNCVVDFAKEGKEATVIYQRELVNGKPFDFVILDLNVRHGMGGLQCLEELIKIDPEVKAIVSSGYSKDPALISYKDYGFIGVLNKPYKIEDFISSFNSILNK